MIQYKTGYRSDPLGYRRNPWRLLGANKGLLLEAKALPSFSMCGNMPQVYDQGQTSSCTGHASSAAIKSCLGTQISFYPSAWLNYTNGRCMARIDYETLNTRLTDDGCEPNQVFRGINAWGIRAMNYPTSDGRISDCELSTINHEPTETDEEEASYDVLIGEYGITSKGSVRGLSVRQAVAGGYPVCLAVAGGSNAFQMYQAGQILSATSESLDHYVCLYGYRERVDNSYIYRIRNSWGDWGENGDCWVDDSFLQECSDLVVCEVAFK